MKTHAVRHASTFTNVLLIQFLVLATANAQFRPDEGAAPRFDRVPAPPRATPGEPPASPMAIPRPKPDGRFRLQLKDGSSVVGKLSVEKPLKLKTNFGDVSIPITKLASLTIDENTKSTKVVFRNGDRLTGQLTTDTLQVKTVWAELAIELKYVQTMIGDDLASVRTEIAFVLISSGGSSFESSED